MKGLIALVTMAIVVLAGAVASAQTGPLVSQDGKTSSGGPIKTRQVIASVAGDSIRITALGELIQIRLEVIGSSGDALFDSDFKPGNLIDWPFSDTQGAQLADGSYLCVVTVRNASGQTTRHHAIASLRDRSISLRQSDRSLLSSAQYEAAGPTIEDEGALTILESGGSQATAILAHNGSEAQLISGSGGLSISSGDVFSKKVVEQVRLTTEGNLGIGVSNPEAKLHVGGMIRSAGIIFPDGSVQLSAATRTLGEKSTRSRRSGDAGGIQPQATGVGTQSRIAKWLDSVGTLGDSAITETSGNVGIGTTNPQTLLHLKSGETFNKLVVDSGTNTGQVSEVAFFDRGAHKWELVKTSDNQFGIYDSAVGYRVYVRNNGNVGIGTTSPNSRLSVTGQIESTIGGFKFPDGTTQTTAATATGGGLTLPFSGSTSSASTGFAVTNNGAGEGVFGKGRNGVHGLSTSATDSGVWGENISAGYGVAGSTNSQAATVPNGTAGVWGANFGTGFGVKGTSNGTGVYGSGTSIGVRGDSNAGIGVYGVSDTGSGAVGITTNGGAGVYGDNGNSNTNGHAGFFNGRVTITGNLVANNSPFVKFSQGRDNIDFGNQDVDMVSFTAPANGVLFISAFVNIRTPGGVPVSHMLADFSLLDSAGATLALVTAEGENQDYPEQRVLSLSWVVPVSAGSVTMKTHLKNNGTAVSFYDHNLSVVYLPAQP